MKRLIQRAVFSIVLLAIAGLAVLEGAFLFGPERALARFEIPTEIGLKTGDLTANINGQRGFFGRLHDGTRFRTNEGPWRTFLEASPRLNAGAILLEAHRDDLVSGVNRMDVVFTGFLGIERWLTVEFAYDPETALLPVRWDWSSEMPETQDGLWERIETPDGWRLRPAVGFEGYDRLALVSPPFDGARRVTLDVTFVGNTGRPYGFGVIPLWGGHNDPDAISPRRGWEYGIAWYYSPPGGFGVEMAVKDGDNAHVTEGVYEPTEIEPGDSFRLVVEATPIPDTAETTGLFAMRLRWTDLSTGDSSDWVEFNNPGVSLPSTEHAVALVAHRAAVEFGTVTIESIPGP